MSHSGTKKILYIVQHRQNRAPGQRYRCEQYIPYLQRAGFECTYSPIIIKREEEDSLYRSRSLWDKGMIFLKALFRRVKDVLRARQYDIVFIYREAMPTGSVFFEKMLKKSGAKIILDFDDAVWLPSVSEVNKSLQWLKKPDKINKIIGLSNLVITGNSYLADYTRKFNQAVKVFPSTIDLDYYKMPAEKAKKTDDKIIIGWSGSHTTIEHFNIIVPVLKKLKEKYGDKIEFIVYGDAGYKSDLPDIKSVAWSSDSEVEIISSFDIGIMPLPDDDWSKGKCSMKGLQYMGLAIPAVLADVGMNKEVVKDGVNGFLAKNEQEWLDKLQKLIENKYLRQSIGLAGRETIEKEYSCQARNKEYVNIFLELSGQKQ